MKYKILFLIFVLSQIALAHEITNTVGNTKISLELLPNEIPKAGKISIIAFEVTDINNRPLSHIDGYLTIRKGNTIIIIHNMNTKLLQIIDKTKESLITRIERVSQIRIPDVYQPLRKEREWYFTF